MQKIAFFRVSSLHPHALFTGILTHTKLAAELAEQIHSPEFQREGEALKESQNSGRAQLPGWGVASPSKEQCCQTLLDLRLSKCPEPSERPQWILRVPDKQSSESLGIITFPILGWSFAACQQLDPPWSAFIFLLVSRVNLCQVTWFAVAVAFYHQSQLSSNILFLVSVIFSTAVLAADFTEALSNGKGELNRTKVKQPLQSLEAKDSAVFKNFNISDRHGRYTRIWNLFHLGQFMYAEIINFNTSTVNTN